MHWGVILSQAFSEHHPKCDWLFCDQNFEKDLLLLPVIEAAFCHGSLQALRTLATWKHIFWNHRIYCLSNLFISPWHFQQTVTQDQHSWQSIFLVGLTGRVIQYLLMRWSLPIDFQPRDQRMKASDRTSTGSGCQSLQFLYVSVGKHYHSSN